MDKKKTKLSVLFVMQLAVCIYTCSGIAAKLASGYDFMSPGFILCYGAEILLLGIYAVFWQQIIKKADISVAYANRASAIFWSTLWAVLIFKEQVTAQNIGGIVLIFLGIWMVNRND